MIKSLVRCCTQSIVALCMVMLVLGLILSTAGCGDSTTADESSVVGTWLEPQDMETMTFAADGSTWEGDYFEGEVVRNDFRPADATYTVEDGTIIISSGGEVLDTITFTIDGDNMTIVSAEFGDEIVLQRLAE